MLRRSFSASIQVIGLDSSPCTINTGIFPG